MKLVNTVINPDGTATLEVKTTLQRTREQDRAIVNKVIESISSDLAFAGWEWIGDSLFIEFDRSMGLKLDYRWATPADRAQYTENMQEALGHFIGDLLAAYAAAQQ